MLQHDTYGTMQCYVMTHGYDTTQFYVMTHCYDTTQCCGITRRSLIICNRFCQPHSYSWTDIICAQQSNSRSLRQCDWAVSAEYKSLAVRSLHLLSLPFLQ